MADYAVPKINTAYIFYGCLVSQADAKLFKSVPTLAAGDFKVSIDGGAFANLATLPTNTPGTFAVKFSLSAAEMNGDNILVVASDAAGAEWCDQCWNIQTAPRGVADLAFPTVTGRSLDVSATGEAGLDWANIGSPTTAQNLSATNIDVDQVVASVSGAVGSVTGAVGSVTGAVGSVTGAVGSVTGNVGGNVVGSVASVTAGVTVSDKTGFSLSTAGILAIWHQLTSAIVTASTIGKLIIDNLNAAISSRSTYAGGAVASVTAGVTVTTNNDKTGYGLSSAAVQAIWDALTSALTTVGSIGKKLADWTIGTAQTGDTYALANGANGFVATKADTAAIKAVTDTIVSVSGTADSGSTTTMVDAARTEADVDYWKGSVLLFTSGNLAGQAAIITDFNPTTDTITFSPALTQAVLTQNYVILPWISVWDDTMIEHLVTGTTGNKLNAAASAGDPWTTVLPGAYGAGSAGKIVGDNINATIASRATQTSVDTVATYVDTEVAAIKAKTDLIPASPAAVGSAMTLAADSITAAVLAADAGVEIAGAVWNEDATAHQTQGTFGQAIGDPVLDTNTIYKAVVTDATGATVGIDVNVIDDFLDTEVAAIKAKTDQMVFTNINKLDAAFTAAADFPQAAADKVWATTTRAITDKVGFALSAAGIQAIWDLATTALVTVGSIGKRLVDNIDAAISSRLATAGYTTPPTTLAIADQVWDEVLAGHLTAGTTGAELDVAGAAGDPWATAIPGAYGVGTAGKIVGDNVNATISSRLASAGYTAPDNAGITAINAKTTNLPADPASAGTIATRFTTVDTNVAAVDTKAAAIKAKTDLLPASPAAVGSAMTLALDSVNALALAADAVAEIQSGLATAAAVATVDARLDTEIPAIKAKTDLIPTDPADASDIAALISPVATKVDEIHKIQGLNAATPMTVTPTSRAAGIGLALVITGDGISTTTVTRSP